VDDAIVDMENCYRGLRTNQGNGAPKDPFQVVYETSIEVRLAVIFSTVPQKHLLSLFIFWFMEIKS